MKYYLFDIDGTLLRITGVGGGSLTRAFKEITGKDNAFEGIRFGGMLDDEILGLAAQNALGRALSSDEREQIRRLYIKKLKDKVYEPGSPVDLCPNVRNILESLKKRGHAMAILTGNWHQGAKTKIGPFKIQHYFDFISGSEDAETRSKLVEVSIKKFEKIYRTPVLKKDIILIGDTPRDIQCAKENGIHVWAVATGPYSYEELKAEGPTRILQTLEEWRK
ncbi:MAG: HAD family hydrolase [bacterium]